MSVDNIEALEKEICKLENDLREKKAQLYRMKNEKCKYSSYTFSSNEIVRYSRQMIMPQVTVSGQIALKRSKVLVVGAGGLGCPAALYLAAAGVGEIHILDYDEVELSNLHRQILHCETDIGRRKVASASDKLKNINSNVSVIPHHMHANKSIVDIIVKYKYDVVLDCSDNAPTRYLLNDVCVINNIPLVSGSALQMEGQLTVYHYQDGPCYRCLFPIPPPAHTVTNCGDGGVLGAVAGVIGVLQALEAVKIITKLEGVLSQRLLLFDGSETTFRNVKLRPKISSCVACGHDPKIISPVDYEQFCGSRAHDKVTNIDILNKEENISVEQLKYILHEGNIVLDVRSELEFAMCRLPNTINFPFSKIKCNQSLEELGKIIKDKTRGSPIYVLCRRGNDSQRTIAYLKETFADSSAKFVNVKGGLHAYSKTVDNSFPVY